MNNSNNNNNSDNNNSNNRNIINRLFSVEDQLKFLSEKKYDRLPAKYKQYKRILYENGSYPNIHSKKQFQTIVNTFFKDGILDNLMRLVLSIQYTIKRRNSTKLLDIFIKGNPNRSDTEFYDQIRKFLEYTKQRINNKPQSQADFIYYHLVTRKLLKSGVNPKKIMDLGCGNGRKAAELGRLFGLSKSNIICADIDKWFDYDDIERNKLNIELLPISEKGPILYKQNSCDVITMIHTLHHWCYNTPEEYIKRMLSLKNILTKDGLIVIFEHYTFSDVDACILDIEHGLWETVLKDNSERFYKEFASKYLNFVEVELIMEKSGFKMIYFKYYDAGLINNHTIPNKSYLAVYRKK